MVVLNFAVSFKSIFRVCVSGIREVREKVKADIIFRILLKMGDGEERIVSDIPNEGREVSDETDKRTPAVQAQKSRNSDMAKRKLEGTSSQEKAQNIATEEEMAQSSGEGYGEDIQKEGEEEINR